MHGALVMLHDVSWVIISAHNPYVSSLRCFVLDERHLRRHVVNRLAHGLDIGGKKGGGTEVHTPQLNQDSYTRTGSFPYPMF